MNIDFNTLTSLISQKLTHWMTDLIRLLPNIVLAAILLVTGFYISRLLRRLSYQLLSRVSKSATLNNLFCSVIYFILIGITLFATLTVLKLDKTVTSILAGAGILGLALAFAFQDIATNFISGIFISIRKPLQVNDIVKIKDYMGRVQEINLRDTVLQTFNGQTVIIPNKDVFQNAIENYSYLHKRRLDLTVGVSYSDDLEKVKRVTLEAVQGIKEISIHDETQFYYTGFGECSINFSVRMWVNSPEQSSYNSVGSQAVQRIKKAFDENNITIPFPIRTLDFGHHAVEKLNEIQLSKTTAPANS